MLYTSRRRQGEEKETERGREREREREGKRGGETHVVNGAETAVTDFPLVDKDGLRVIVQDVLRQLLPDDNLRSFSSYRHGWLGWLDTTRCSSSGGRDGTTESDRRARRRAWGRGGEVGVGVEERSGNVSKARVAADRLFSLVHGLCASHETLTYSSSAFSER